MKEGVFAMMNDCTLIIGIRLANRNESAVEVQKVLTDYGCCIRTRLGLHEQEQDGTCSPSGVLLLQLCCEEEEGRRLEKALVSIEGVKAQLINLR